MILILNSISLNSQSFYRRFFVRKIYTFQIIYFFRITGKWNNRDLKAITLLPKKFWVFRLVAIELAMSRNHRLPARMSEDEEKFGIGWAGTTRYLAPIEFTGTGPNR